VSGRAQTEVDYRNDGDLGAALNGAPSEKTLKITRIAHSCALLAFGGSRVRSRSGYHRAMTSEPIVFFVRKCRRVLNSLPRGARSNKSFFKESFFNELEISSWKLARTDDDIYVTIGP
jgi:hypothetical protein